MSDAEKTEEPTAKKQQNAREEGKVASSRDIGGVAIAGAFSLVLVFNGEALAADVAGLFARSMETASGAAGGTAAEVVRVALDDALATSLRVLGLVGGLALVVGGSAGFAQTGGNVAMKSLGFKWDRLDALAGLKRALASKQALSQVGLSIAKALVLGTALGIVLMLALPEIAMLASVDLRPAMIFVGKLLLQVFVIALFGSAITAVADLLISANQLHEELKMTKQEVKDEHKQQEGDPAVRGRMRQRMREIGRNQMIAATAKSDVVVVNPTHYAVAISYRMGQSGAPKLLAKGKDLVAARIREVARKHQIPIVANPPVARAVYAGARIGQEVPAELYEVVARVLAYLYRLGPQRRAA